jgi:hypothetical protein
VLRVCTDVLWAHLDDDIIGGAFGDAAIPLAEALPALGAGAVALGGATADNTSAVVLRFLE